MPKITPIHQEPPGFDALRHLYKNQRGYMKELKQTIGEELVDEFKNVGFIRSGFTKKAETYKMTELGKGYVKEAGLDITV